MLQAKHLFYLISILLFPNFIQAQYTETFTAANRGILSGTCSNNNPTSCASFDFTGVDWTIGGNLSGVDSEGFFTTSGYLHASDLDEEACWISPTLDISSAANISFTVIFTIPAGSGWDSGSAPGSIDYADVKYSIDGSAFITLPNASGCPASPYTISGNECSGLIGPLTFTPTISGLSGNTLDIQVCFDTNSSSEFGRIEEISVPQANVVILPVELISFKGEKGEKEILLKWVTASELNNEKFEIEHSSNNRPYEKIGEVNGHGTTYQVSNYSFQHFNPTIGNNYYRLKQVDSDNQFEYSRVIAISFEKDNGGIGNFYPNPSKTGIVNLDFNAHQNTDVIVTVFDMTGEMVSKQVIRILKGGNHFDFSILRNGVYHVRIETERAQTYRKLILTR